MLPFSSYSSTDVENVQPLWRSPHSYYGVAVYPQQVQFCCKVHKKTNIYTHTHTCVRDMIILLHTIISPKFSTATDSDVFRVKCVINSIFYIHSAWTFLWGYQMHSFVWGLHILQMLEFHSEKPIEEKLHTVLFSALIVSRSVASLSAVLLESTSSCLQLYLQVTSTTSSTSGRK